MARKTHEINMDAVNCVIRREEAVDWEVFSFSPAMLTRLAQHIAHEATRTLNDQETGLSQVTHAKHFRPERVRHTALTTYYLEPALAETGWA